MNKIKEKLYTRKGQSVVEYFVLFSIISLATFVVLNNGFLSGVRSFAGEIFRIALGRLKG